MPREKLENKQTGLGDSGRLLDAFERPTHQQWREVAEKSLKGGSFEKRLISKTYEGIDRQPLYEPSPDSGRPEAGMPGIFPFTRGTRPLGRAVHPWLISQETAGATPKTVNLDLREALSRGQTAINLILDSAAAQGGDPAPAASDRVGQGGTSVATSTDLADLFEGIDLTRFPIHIGTGSSQLALCALLLAYAAEHGVAPAELQGSVEIDPLGTLARTGAVPRPLARLLDEAAWVTAHFKDEIPGVSTLGASGLPYQSAGASAVEELGFVLATGVAYLRELRDRGLGIDEIAPRIRFTFGVGSDFFMEISKLRAARSVWACAVDAFGGTDAAKRMALHVRTATWNKTIRDPHTNILRATTEAFSGIISGADSLHVGGFDEAARSPDALSKRLARNTQLVLQQESHLGAVVDPAGGSWYVEQLTFAVARGAWGLFQEIEQLGGMAEALKRGFPQERVARTAEARARDLASRKAVLVGTNLYPNAGEKPLASAPSDRTALVRERIEQLDEHRASRDSARCERALEALSEQSGGGSGVVTAAVAAAAAGATLGELTRALAPAGGKLESVAPLEIHRGAEMYEALLAQAGELTVRSGKPPQVFLANMGPLAQHKARADFSAGFFEVGGFQVLGNDGFDTPEAAAEATVRSGAPIAVVCSTDPTYPELVPRFIAGLGANKAKIKVVLAGFPKDQVAALRSAGIDELIHLRANNYEILSGFLKTIGAQA